MGFAEVMRAHAAETLLAAGVEAESISHREPLLDTCGTGGDGRGTLMSRRRLHWLRQAAGVRVAKHGNRSISSRCGSADVLETLGVAMDLPLERIPQCLDEVGMVFLLAPRLHLAMKHVMNARRSLKTKSVFNLLGPLTNPLAATIQLVGVFDSARTEMMAETLRAVGTRRPTWWRAPMASMRSPRRGPRASLPVPRMASRRAIFIRKSLVCRAPRSSSCKAATLPPMRGYS